MFSVEVRDRIMIGHSLPDPFFGPAQAMHGATFVVDVAFFRESLTRQNVVVDIGAALTVTLNIPYTEVGSADLDLRKDGTGTIALGTLGNTRLSYLVCWPHVRPWQFRTQPALRCIPEAKRVAQLLAIQAEERVGLADPMPRVGRAAMAAE